MARKATGRGGEGERERNAREHLALIPAAVGQGGRDPAACTQGSGGAAWPQVVLGPYLCFCQVRAGAPPTSGCSRRHSGGAARQDAEHFPHHHHPGGMRAQRHIHLAGDKGLSRSDTPGGSSPHHHRFRRVCGREPFLGGVDAHNSDPSVPLPPRERWGGRGEGGSPIPRPLAPLTPWGMKTEGHRRVRGAPPQNPKSSPAPLGGLPAADTPDGSGAASPAPPAPQPRRLPGGSRGAPSGSRGCACRPLHGPPPR